MRILVIGGMHGNEPLGFNVARLFQDKPQKGIGVVIANEMAVNKNARFIKQDLNRAFPGSLRSNNYEKKRAGELLKLCKRYDLVLDFHNTYCPNNDCTFVGNQAKDLLFDVSSFLGLNRIIIADYDCINKYAPNCLSVEISLKSSLMDPMLWYESISKLAMQKSIPRRKSMQKYKFVYRMTLEDRDRLKLDERNLKAFKPINAELAKKMGVKTPAFPIFIKDKYTPYNFGGLLNRI